MEVKIYFMQGKTKKDNMNISKNKEKPKKLEEIVIMLLIEEVAEEEEEDNLLKLNKLQKKKNKHQLNDYIHLIIDYFFTFVYN